MKAHAFQWGRRQPPRSAPKIAERYTYPKLGLPRPGVSASDALKFAGWQQSILTAALAANVDDPEHAFLIGFTTAVAFWIPVLLLKLHSPAFGKSRLLLFFFRWGSAPVFAACWLLWRLIFLWGTVEVTH